jgi:hypothetical protein
MWGEGKRRNRKAALETAPRRGGQGSEATRQRGEGGREMPQDGHHQRDHGDQDNAIAELMKK